MQVREGRAEWSWSQVVASRGTRLDRFEADLRSTGALIGDVLSFSFSSWAAAGEPPDEADGEAFDTWVLFQEALFDTLIGNQQTVTVSSFGFVGASGASLEVLINGQHLPTLDAFAAGA